MYKFTKNCLGLLEILNLANNHISFLDPTAFVHLTRLIILDLSKNNLKQIPPRVFFTLVHLNETDLSEQKNGLRQVDDYAFERRAPAARPISVIDLSNNSKIILSNLR